MAAGSRGARFWSVAQASVFVLVLTALSAGCGTGSARPYRLPQSAFDVLQPRVAMDDLGNAYLNWLEVYPDSDRGALRRQFYLTDSSWGPETSDTFAQSETESDEHKREHRVVMTGHLEHRTVYKDQHLHVLKDMPSVYTDAIRRRAGSGAASTPGEIHFVATENLEHSSESHTGFSNPRVAVNRQGNDCVVWQELQRICVQQYEEASDHVGLYEPCVELGTGTTYRVAIDEDGNALVVWISTEEGKPGLFASRTPFLETVQLEDGEGLGDVELAVDGSGNGVLAYLWNGVVFARGYDAAGDSWDAGEWISPGVASADDLDLAVNESGDAVLVYEIGGDVHGAFYGEPTSDFQLTGDGAGHRVPDVTIDGDGNAICVWEQGKSVLAAQYSAAGEAWSSNQVLGTGSQPQVAGNASGDALAVWRAEDLKSVVRRFFKEPSETSELTLRIYVRLEGDLQPEASVTVTDEATQSTLYSGWTDEDGAYACSPLTAGQSVKIDVDFAGEVQSTTVVTLDDADGDGLVVVGVNLWN